MNFTVQLKDASGKGANRRLRAEGLTSGVIYGKSGNTMVQFRADQGARFIDSFHGAVQSFDLTIEGGKKPVTKKVILKDSQFSVWGDRLLHADFMEVKDDTKVKVEVPLRPSDCEATKLGAVVQVIRRTIPVVGAMKDIPAFLDVDIQEMNYGQSVHVLSIDYPEGVKPLTGGRDFTVLTIAGKKKGREEEEEEETLEEGAEAAAEGAETTEG